MAPIDVADRAAAQRAPTRFRRPRGRRKENRPPMGLATFAFFERFEERTILSTLRLATILDAALVIFFGRLLLTILLNPRMLLPRYGRSHRLIGMLCLAYQMLGIADARPTLECVSIPPSMVFWYDVGPVSYTHLTLPTILLV